jgi:hypothetical protein
MGMGRQRHALAALPPGKTWYPSYRKLDEPQGWVCTGAENLGPTRIQSPDHPAGSEPLYQLSYRNLYKSEWTPLPLIYLTTLIMCVFLQC